MWRSAVQVCLGLHILLSRKGYGGLAQLARAPALQAGGQRFESVILHVFVRKRIDAVNPISDTLMMDEANPDLDTGSRVLTEIFDILTHKTVSNEDFVFRN